MSRHVLILLLGVVLAACHQDNITPPSPVYLPLTGTTVGEGGDYSGLLAKQTIHYTRNDTLVSEIGLIFSNDVDITPLYAFQNGNSGGDYYIVDATTNVYTSQIYKADSISNYVVFPFADNATFCGYYLKELYSEYHLVDSAGRDIGEFPAGHFPTPSTTLGTTTYTTGFSFGISGSVKIVIKAEGVYIVPQLSVGFNFINSAEREASGPIDVQNNTQSPVPAYLITLNDLPDLGNINVPEHAQGISSFHQSWIWRVPSTADGDTLAFRLKSSHQLEFLANSIISNQVGEIYARDKAVLSQTFKVTPPNRVPMGALVIKNTENSLYVSDIKIFREGQKEPVYVDNSPYAPGQSFRLNLDVGKYYVELGKGKTYGQLDTYPLALDYVEVKRDQSVNLESYFHF